MLTPSALVEILKQRKINASVDVSSETDVVRALIQFYAAFLCQDPQDGTPFDMMVMDTLEMLHPKAEHRNTTYRRTHFDTRVAFIKNKMLGRTVVVRPLKEGDPKESDLYCPLPEYGVALWIDKPIQ